MTTRKALIIDDDPIYQLVAQEMLLAIGFEDVLLADDGAIGLQMVVDAPQELELILCDLQMPNLDGVSVVRELAAVKYEGKLIIASSEEGDVINTVQRMAQMFGIRILGSLAKPISETALSELLVRTYESPQHKPAKALTRHSLRMALQSERIVPFYQPKLNLETGAIDSAEVLARYYDESGHPSSPAKSLEAAEKYGLTHDYTFALVDQVIADDRRMRIQDQYQLNLSINISPTMLDDLDLPDMLARRFKKAGIETKRITLEVIEDRMLTYKPSVLEVLSRLRLHGFKLSIDDFGTGATSIEQLRLYPFNELKIDKSFVENMLTDDFARTSVETSIKLAKMLNLSIVAEGIETTEQLEFVRNAGVMSIQGYLVSEPIPQRDLANLLSTFDEDTFRKVS